MVNETALRATGRGMGIQEWFDICWNRRIPDLLDMPGGLQLNLGAGYRQIGQSSPLDVEHGWNADTDPLPYQDWSVSGIWANGFFEHVREPVEVLGECARVLRTGGVMNICVPHGMCQNAFGDLDHKKFYTEDSFKNLLENRYWDALVKHPKNRLHLSKMTVHTSFFMGVEWKNVALLTQLVKSG